MAEDVEKVIQDLFVYDNQGKSDAIRYNVISLYLLEVVKELKAENDLLKNRIEVLEGK